MALSYQVIFGRYDAFINMPNASCSLSHSSYGIKARYIGFYSSNDVLHSIPMLQTFPARAMLTPPSIIMQTGKTISRASLRTGPPKRPAEGWSLVVRPAGRGQDYEPFVAKPDGTRRAPSEDESLYLKRMKPLPRRRIL